MRCIMMCAGEYRPEDGFSCGKEDLVIAVDGGLRRLRELGIRPGLLLGDFDSLAEEDLICLQEMKKEDPASVIRLPVIKDESDTQAAARIALEKGCREFWLYGAMGGRLDHTIANLQTLLWLRRKGACGRMIGNGSTAAVFESEEFRIPENFDGTVSLFAMGEKLEGVTIRGMKYEITDADLTNDFPIGTSNETLPGKQGIFSIRRGAAVVILTERLHNLHK